MSKVPQLKRKAAECEQKKQYDRALALYLQAIEATERPDDRDIQLYNRVGDLYLRLGDLDQAVHYYEQAVDLYTEGGFFSNAIALCNKVLRHVPSRNLIYYKLGKISAKKGFNSDAKRNFLEYAGRMQQSGGLDEAFRALKEFADLCPGQDDVRLMLAEQLARVDRGVEALEQLQIVYETMLAEDRQTEAAATLDRIRAIDPNFAPRQGRAQRQIKRDGLVFLDINPEPNGVQSAGVVEPADVSDEPVGPQPADLDAVAPISGLEFTTLVEDAGENVVLSEDNGQTHEVIPHVADDVSPLDGIIPVEDPLLALASITSVQSAEEAVAGLPLDSTSEPELSSGIATIESAEVVATADLATSDDLVFLDTTQTTPLGASGEAQRVATAISDTTSDADDFVDLTAWLRESQPVQNPRMTAEDEEETTGAQQQADFTEMLETFKRGIAQNVDESDSESHYDLGVAYMEMGLFTEAITQFQKVLRGNSLPERRVRAYECLGHCFIEQGAHDIALASLVGAISEPGLSEDKLVGVLYLLGYASELTGKWSDAEMYYKRVVAIDITFRDVNERLRRAVRTAVA